MSARATLIFFLAPILVAAEPKEQIVDGVKYHVLRVSADQVRIVWKDNADQQLRMFPDVAKYLTANGEAPATLMNGGIFEPGGVPSGLLIQNGRELRPLNRADGKGNFFLKPNGIFLISDKGPAVIKTPEYPLEDAKVSQAVQSGPLLLRNGERHPVFKVDSKYRLHRNGVGVDGDGLVVFAMTDFNSPKFPTLYEFAELFRTLGCKDALFLDGDISQMRSGAELERSSNNFGSIIAVLPPSE
ncbi:MAG: phosphodiester glycosidase family protein [Verrucomicrobiota bacterium]